MGPWPVQPFAGDQEPHGAPEGPADRGPRRRRLRRPGQDGYADPARMTDADPAQDGYADPAQADRADPGLDGYAAAAAGEDIAGRDPRGRWQESRGRAAPPLARRVGFRRDAPAPATLRYARQPPPLPRRTPRHGPGWNDEAPGQLPGQPVREDRSGRVRLPSAPDPVPPGTAQFAAPAALSESDELFRAWQGSVRDAAGPRTRGPAAARPARPHAVAARGRWRGSGCPPWSSCPWARGPC